jgi:hypothetical protein
MDRAGIKVDVIALQAQRKGIHPFKGLLYPGSPEVAKWSQSRPVQIKPYRKKP